MSDNKAIIQKFYTAFAASDFQTMSSCYHENVEFEDPAFGKLKGSAASDMWEMLVEGSKLGKGGLKIEFSDITSNENVGSAKWIATYNFGKTGRLVVIKVQANFEFKDGLIIKHTDVFDFWKWSSQALGTSGYLFGWCSCLKNKVHMQANERLDRFIAKKYKQDEVSNVV